MKFGLQLRNSGPHATRALLRDCACIADHLPIDDLWVFDHLAIPPDQSEGSGGLYVEPLATLAFVAGITERVGIGTKVLILPYRPALLTAKWVASIQELSGGRLHLGVGVGWMDAEFKALGVARSRRGALTDAALELLHRCFAADEVEVNGESILFLPRPQRPPIYIGGAPPHALRRAVRFGDGWMPPSSDPEELAPSIGELRRLNREAGKPAPEVVVTLRQPLEDDGLARQQVARLGAVGVTRIALALPYESTAEFGRIAEGLVRIRGGD